MERNEQDRKKQALLVLEKLGTLIPGKLEVSEKIRDHLRMIQLLELNLNSNSKKVGLIITKKKFFLGFEIFSSNTEEYSLSEDMIYSILHTMYDVLEGDLREAEYYINKMK